MREESRYDWLGLARQLGGGQQTILDGARQSQLFLCELGFFEARRVLEHLQAHGFIKIEPGAEEDGEHAVDRDAGGDLVPVGGRAPAEAEVVVTDLAPARPSVTDLPGRIVPLNEIQQLRLDRIGEEALRAGLLLMTSSSSGGYGLDPANLRCLG